MVEQTAVPQAQEQDTMKAGRDRASSGMLRKELDMRLTAYLPAVVRRHLERQDMHKPLPMPTTHRTTVVSMFADVSGFTAMTESLAARGPVGAEDLAKHLNSYFEQLLRLVSSAGGDVFKFAGDAMLIFWPESKEDTMDSLLRRALQCALRIQSHLHEAELARGVVLSVKVGVGIGEATIAHLGGESDGATTRIEYVAVGPALEQAFSAEHQAEAGDVICSSECWKRVSEFFDGAPVRGHGSENGHGNSFHKVTGVNKPVKICSRRPSFTRHDALLHKRMKQYVSRAVWPYLDAHDEFWGSELRDVTVLFINLGFSEQDLAQMLGAKELQRLQDAFANVQKCVYDYEGTINKFLVDDKGSTIIAAFGLPPVTHENDPIRGILASLAICAALGNIGLKASVGITTGTALCGVVGHQGNRREYTVLGDIVNLSARLMQRAKSEGGGVITDAPTKTYTHDVLHFEKRPEIMVKGKNESIKIHRPYPRMSILLDYHLSSAIQQSSNLNSVRPVEGIVGRAGRANALSVVSRTSPMQNLMENMHRVQVRDAQRRLSLRADRQRLPAEELVESESFVEVRTALLDKCSHLNPFAPGGAFVLEGDIGVGKTVLLRSALASPEAGDYQVLVGTASPFATKKPYAIWSELITRSAREMSETTNGNINSEPAPPLSPDVGTTTSSSPAVQAPSRVAETERRKCVAQFVRQKIREGAAPNKTLVRYAPLLNAILDTDFDAYPDITDTGAEPVETLKNGDNNCQDGELPATNQSEEETTEENQRQNEEEMRACGYAFAESPDRTFNVKEQEIASWFLGLLEMDLAQKEEARASLSDSPYMDTRSESSDDNNEDEQESERRPIDLDLSGILLLCALYAMSRERATVFCLDSAMYMDEKSWTLVAIIAKYFTNCLIVVGTRPPSLALGEHTESSSFRKQLRLLKHMKSSTCTSLDTFSSDEIGVLSRQILKVPDIADNLLEILMSRSQGNPLFLHEIIAEMKEQQVLQVDEKKGIRKCELHVQEPWGDKYKAQFCFSCHASFSKKDKDKLKEKDVDMLQGIEEAARKTKHRCKCCGYVFCAECTPKACQAKLPGKPNEPVRHCRTCYNLASSRRPSGSSHGIGTAVGTINDKRVRPKGRLRSMFQSGSSGDQSVLSSASSISPPVSSAPTLTNRIALRPPRTVKSVLTTMLDQLTMSQRMLMKTASAIGSTFDKETLRGTCPIEAHLSRFAHDLEDLEQLAMIRRIDTFIGGVPASSKPSSVTSGAILTSSQIAPPSSHVKVKFEFNHGFMRGVIREQMLRGQLDKLNARIADFREQQQKELRHKFFSKANESLSRPQQLNIAVSPIDGGGFVQGIRRALTPTGTGMGNSRSPVVNDGRRRRLLSRRNSHSDVEPTDSNRSHQGMVSNTATGSSDSSPESSTTQALQESEYEDGVSPVVNPCDASTTSLLSTSNTFHALHAPTFTRLKASRVLVKKYSSMFSHLKLKGLKNARQWKTRYAVLENTRLLLQYDEDDPVGTSSKPAPQHQGALVGTLLSLKGAKVHACDPEVATKVNCFQVEVSEWTKKGKVIKDERRSFIIGVESEEEVENWVYLIRYAIESLESQPVSLQLQSQYRTRLHLMASPSEGEVVDVTMEDERSQEEDEREEKEGEHETEESEVVELDGDEQEHKQESDDDVQFVGSVEGANGEEDVVIMESKESNNSTERSRADTDAMMAAKGFVTPSVLEAELQCIICQYAMFKPVSAICGHSFCRVCLMDSFLTRPIEETQCPICRVDILKPICAKSSLASVFSVNVTLWNLVQLLIPSVAERISSYQEEEEQKFTQKLDQLDVKWKNFTLSERAAIYHGNHEEEDERASDRWETDREGFEEYPVLKVEETRDGNLHVSRNVVLDTNDENEDGYLNMRVGIAIVEFPSVFELYNEHQECSVNVIKMEEDEEISDGMPFFMNEDGDDDGFVCSSYYNEISLHVCDEAGNCVMERTRGAQSGVVTFPGLRLDVPGGLYTFLFSDDLYGLKLSITTRLREPHEISDTPVADYVSLIQGEARDAGRRNRNRHHDSDNEEDHDEEGNESDDSFIVDDLTGGAHHEEPVGRFSDDEDEGHWEYHSDDEAADEEREQRRLRQRLRSGRRSERDVQFVEENHERDLSGEEDDHEADGDEHEVDEREEDEEVDDEVRPGRRNVRVIEEATFSSEAEQEGNDASDAGENVKGEEEEQHKTYDVARSRRRNANQIVDSEDEDDGAPAESDEEKKEDVISDGANDHSENDIAHSGGGAEDSSAGDEHGSDDDDDDDDTVVQPPTRKLKRAQWFQGDESDEEAQEPVFSVSQRDEAPRRPRKRTRARDRQVRVVDEGESDEEQEQMERSIIAANSEHAHDNDDDDDDDSESQFRRVHLYDEEEAEERHEYEDAQDEYDDPDYPDDENEYQEEQDDDF